MKTLVAVALGGALGAVGRYLVAMGTLRMLGPHFPWGTLTVNIAGSFIMGVLVELMALRLAVTPEWRAFLFIGVLGGFTTFSAFSLDAAVMFERGDAGFAMLYVVTSVCLAVGGLFAGLWFIRLILT